MIKNVIRGAITSIALISIPAAAPVPVYACNIANPPPPCANLPGGNPVSGTGTLFQNRFQGVPGVSPGGGDGFFFVNNHRQLNDGREFGTPAQSGAGDGLVFPNGTRERAISQSERERAVNDELELIQREYRDNLDAITDPRLQDQTIGLMALLRNNDELRLELQEERKNQEAFGAGQGIGPVDQSDNAHMDDEIDSIMDEIESVIVKM